MATRLEPPYDTADGLVCTDVLKALPLVEYRFAQHGWIEEDFSGLVFQWGYKNNAIDASSTTHNGGGVFDVDYSLVDSDDKLVVWQQCGFAPFRRRRPQWTLTKHGHICVIGCDDLDPLAARQVEDFQHGRNGLKGHAEYDGPVWGFRTWQQAQHVYADLIEEMNMPSSKEIAKEVLTGDGYVNNVGFAPGSAGKYVSLADAVEGIIAQLQKIPGAGTVAGAVDKALADDRAATQKELKALGDKLDAVLKALPKA